MGQSCKNNWMASAPGGELWPAVLRAILAKNNTLKLTAVTHTGERVICTVMGALIEPKHHKCQHSSSGCPVREGAWRSHVTFVQQETVGEFHGGENPPPPESHICSHRR